MENQQMQMPAAMPQVMPPQEMGASGADPMAVFEQLRQQVSPQDFSNQMLEGAAEVDPQAVAEFKQALQGLNVPVEVISALNDLVDAVLAEPSNYRSLREELIKEGVPEDFLPEQFDPEFFAALNIAVDQMMATSTGVQAFAQGGIAELKPIAKAIASYGRNGDTMLAHITPGEARLLQRRGGAGTINPYTGLPEFFLKGLVKGIGNAFKSVGKAISSTFKSIGSAVKKFTSSTVGRLVTGLAIGFFLGPAAVAFFGATAGTITAAAITGFTASAGSSLLAGDGLKTAIKQGVVGAATAGAIQGVGSAINPKFSMTGQAPIDGAPPPTAMEALQTQYNKVFAPTPTGTPTAITGGGPAPLPSATQPPISGLDLPPDFNFPSATQATQPPINGLDLPANYTPPAASTNVASAGTGPLSSTLDSAKSMFDSATGFVKNNFSPSAIREAGADEALAKVSERFGMTPAQVAAEPANSIIGKAYLAELPGILSTYGPATALGLGATALAGGFTAKPVQSGPVSESNRLSADERMRRDGTERLNYLQNMPGVVYNEQGEPISGQSTPFPAYVSPGYANSSNMPFVSSAQPNGPFQGMSSMYTPPPNSLTNRAGGIYQPYNNQSMYPSLAPPQFPIRYAAQGGIAGLAAGGYPRRTGQISGPGTEKSDSIPAMLSDGEFVMTASAVRGAGKGSRREGAKKMYKLMHQLEKNSERG